MPTLWVFAPLAKFLATRKVWHCTSLTTGIYLTHKDNKQCTFSTMKSRKGANYRVLVLLESIFCSFWGHIKQSLGLTSSSVFKGLFLVVLGYHLKCQESNLSHRKAVFIKKTSIFSSVLFSQCLEFYLKKCSGRKKCSGNVKQFILIFFLNTSDVSRLIANFAKQSMEKSLYNVV